ncbi:metallophosphoesterase [bacterium]|nr:metallophosphoesterase [bacterium]
MKPGKIDIRITGIIILFLFNSGLSYAQDVAFVAAADNRGNTAQFRVALQEINDMTLNQTPLIPFPEFFIICGDFDPVRSNMEIYNDIVNYPNLPPFYPVVGNHEYETPEDMDVILNTLLPDLKNVVNWGEQGTYSFNYGKVHCVVLDQYAENPYGEVDEDLLAWLQQDLNATDQDHVFVFGHEPAFPRGRHMGDALDQYPETRNAFWKMLLKDPRVRAYFCGHTHYYSRMRVLDPANVGSSGFPNEPGGLYQIDTGNIGNAEGDGLLTLVYTHIKEDSVLFRAISTPRLDTTWTVTSQWSIPGTRRYDLSIAQPLAGTEISGLANIEWSVSGGIDPSRETTLYVSNNAGAQWDTLWSAATSNTTYAWDTNDYADGTRYLLRIMFQGDSGFGLAQSQDSFTINNPGNAVPELILRTPGEDDQLSGEFQVEWSAADADGDVILISLETSLDDGASWKTLAINEPNDGVYIWDTQTLPNSTHYKLKMKCTDGVVWAEDISQSFSISNTRITMPDTIFNHIQGNGDGYIIANIIEPNLLKDHHYRITFDDTTSQLKTYDVYDLDSGSMVVNDAWEMDGKTEGPLFDGMRLLMHDYQIPIADHNNSGWTVGGTELTHQISLPVIDMGTYIINGEPYPANYRIDIYDHVVDTSSSFLGALEIPVNFTVLNETENYPVDFLFVEIDQNHTISPFDEVYIIENDETGEPYLTWRIFFSGDTSYISPASGNIFSLKILKPFTCQDIFEGTQSYTDVIPAHAGIVPRGFSLYQNYPNPFNHETTITFFLPKTSKVILKIYNILGQEVKTLVNNFQAPGEKTISWNGRNAFGRIVDSGVYIYSLQAGGQNIKRKLIMLK